MKEARSVGFALILLVIGSAVADNASPYQGHKVVKAFLESKADVDFVSKLQGIDVWTFQSLLLSGTNNTFAMPPESYSLFKTSSKIQHEVVINDLALSIIQKQQQTQQINKRSLSTPPLGDEWFANWHTYSEMQEKLHELSTTFSNFTEFIPEIGKSFEGRAISGIKLGHGKRVVVFISGTHAREWIAEAVTLWFIGASLDDFKKTGESPFPDATVYVVPCYNPDGYEYSRTSYRYWRKNRRHNSDGTYGVDQNRNWDIDWCIHGSSKSTSSDIYCGTSPFSESETKSVSEWIKLLQPQSLIDFHSNAAMLLRPYGYKYDTSPDDSKLASLGSAMAAKIKAVHGTNYVSQVSVALYPSSGGADDWSYEKSGNVHNVYTVELAGSDFVVPVSDITIQGEEMYPALILFANAP